MTFIQSLGYQPGTPGIQWTERQALIIRSKILYLWKNDKTTVKDFDFGSPGAKSLKYVFDEDKHLSTKDCGNKGLCGTYWASNVRLNHLAFSKVDFE